MTHRRLFAACAALLLSSGAVLGLMDCDSNAPTCLAGSEKCACAKNNACLTGLTCLSSICVNASSLTTSTTAGTTATTGSGGGGTTGTGGAASTTAGTGGATTAASSSGGTGGSVSTGPCAPNTIDDFSSCDMSICNTSGRSGMWHTVMDANAMQTFTVSTLPSPWNDTTCAAWTTGGPGGAYAGFGTQLANGSAYDLSPWGGMTLVVESSHDIFLQVKEMDGGVFQVNIPGMDGTSVPHSFRFTDLQYVANTGGSTTLDLTKITDVQVMADLSAGFGYALHSITLDN